MSNKDKKREFSKKKLSLSLLKKRVRLLTRKKLLRSTRPSSLNLRLPELPKKLKSKSVSSHRRLKLKNMSKKLFKNRQQPWRSK